MHTVMGVSGMGGGDNFSLHIPSSSPGRSTIMLVERLNGHNSHTNSHI